MEPTEDFRKTAETFAREHEAVPPVDPNVKRRNDLTAALFSAISAGAQARANLLVTSRREGGSTFRDATSWREAEAKAQMALAALIEFEVELLLS